MIVILFEDRLVPQLHPVTVGRPAFEISCGSYQLIDLVRRLGPVKASVRPHLRELLKVNSPDLAPGEAPFDEPALLVNARMAPTVAVENRLREFVQRGKPAIVYTGESVAAVLLSADGPPPVLDATCWWSEYFRHLSLDSHELDLPLFEYPHDILRHHQTALAENLADRLSRGDYREIADGVFAASGAKLGQYVVTDTHEGPVVLEEDATVRSHCFLSGPAHVGRATRIIEYAAIKEGTAVGHTCKIGGEVECSIIESYTNKQHHGFLGHSYLGSWVNLGAGTCNSDLKNTYGPVSMEYGDQKVATGMQFIGCIIGDYAKTAINTSVFTGKTIGACSMVYGFVTTNVPSFVNYARLFGQVTEIPVEVEIATQARMFKRRDVIQRPCDMQLLRDMYELTRHERQLANEPLSF